MSSQEPIALVTDVLRGQVKSVVPAGTTVIVGVPAPDAAVTPGVFVHPLRITVSTARRNQAPERRADGTLSLPALHVDLDYLIGGRGGEALAELALLDAVLQRLHDTPMPAQATMGAGLSQPERWAALASGSLTVRWLLPEVPLEQAAAIWVACGIPQRAGIFVRAEVSWRADPPPSGPVVES